MRADPETKPDAICQGLFEANIARRAKINTSQTKLRVGCNNRARPASVVDTCGKLLAMNIQPMQCDNMP